MEIKQKMKELNLKITELSTYLKNSRTTLYKQIEMYDGVEREELPNKVLKLFDYICSSDTKNKNQVVSYLLSMGKEIEDVVNLNSLSNDKRMIVENVIKMDDYKAKALAEVVKEIISEE